MPNHCPPETSCQDQQLATEPVCDLETPEPVCGPEVRGGSCYLVRAGDSLGSIAAATYGDGSLWERIRSENVEKVLSDDSILVGTFLDLPVIEVQNPCAGIALTPPAVEPVVAFDAALAAFNDGDFVKILAAVAEGEFRALAGRMDAAATQWALAINTTYVASQAAVMQRLRAERVVQTAEGLEGDLYWAGGSGPGSDGQISRTTRRSTDASMEDGAIGPESETNDNEFALWIRGEGPEPTTAGKMNCWEAVMFSAYLGGVVTKAWLVGVHARAATAGDYHDSLAAALGFGGARQMTATSVPARGDVVFMDGMAHVALALGSTTSDGKHEVMSLWILPRDGARLNSTFQRTTIEDINGEWNAALGQPAMNVKFAPCPF